LEGKTQPENKSPEKEEKPKEASGDKMTKKDQN